MSRTLKLPCDVAGLLREAVPAIAPEIAPESLFTLLFPDGVPRAEWRVVSFNPNIGDTVIFELARLPAMQRLLEIARVEMHGASGRVVDDAPGLRFRPIAMRHAPPRGARVDQAALLEAFSQAAAELLDGASPEATFVLWDAASPRKWLQDVVEGRDLEPPSPAEEEALVAALDGAFRAALTGRGLTALGWRHPLRPATWGRHMLHFTLLGGASTEALGAAGREVEALPEGARRVALAPAAEAGLEARAASLGLRTTYEVSAFYWQLVFGSKMALEWPLELYRGPAADDAAAARFLARTFEAHPGAPLVLLNLNSRARYKRVDLADDYAPLVDGLARRILALPPVVLLINPPEPDLPEALRAAFATTFEALGDEFPGRVALLPPHAEVRWSGLFTRAVAVVSQCSGFVHVASVLNGRVLPILRDDGSGQMAWRRPGQDFAFYGRREDGPGFERSLDAIARWVKRQPDVARHLPREAGKSGHEWGGRLDAAEAVRVFGRRAPPAVPLERFVFVLEGGLGDLLVGMEAAYLYLEAAEKLDAQVTIAVPDGMETKFHGSGELLPFIDEFIGTSEFWARSWRYELEDAQILQGSPHGVRAEALAVFNLRELYLARWGLGPDAGPERPEVPPRMCRPEHLSLTPHWAERLGARGFWFFAPDTATTTRAHKEWSRAAWLELAELISAETEDDVLVATTAPELLEALAGRPRVMTTSYLDATFRHLCHQAAVLRRARAVVTLDSGFAHMAALIRRRAVVLFGPTSPRFYGRRANVNLRVSNCPPCSSDLPRALACEENVCMQQLTPRMVFEIARSWAEAP